MRGEISKQGHDVGVKERSRAHTKKAVGTADNQSVRMRTARSLRQLPRRLLLLFYCGLSSLHAAMVGWPAARSCTHVSLALLI